MTHAPNSRAGRSPERASLRAASRTAKLYLDQYGNRFYARTLKQLKAQISGRVSIMYRDQMDGLTVRAGYVIGQHWLTAYIAFEQPAFVTRGGAS
jgi:hypothetical protein